jgi:hypothetical protein
MKNAAKKAEERRLVDHFVAAWNARDSFADSVPPPPRHIVFDTAFDRVFFLDHWPVRHGEPRDRVVELPIRRLPGTIAVG